jgi:cation/acetate symporter
MAKFNLHGTVNTAVIKGGDLYAPEASIKAEDRPDWMKRWEKTGLLKFKTRTATAASSTTTTRPKNDGSQGQGRSRRLEGQRAVGQR